MAGMLDSDTFDFSNLMDEDGEWVEAAVAFT